MCTSMRDVIEDRLKLLVFLRIKNDRVDIARAMNDADYGKVVFIRSEIGAILTKHMKAKPWSDPIACHARDTKKSDAMKIGDKVSNKAISGNVAVERNIVVDIVKIVLGGVRNYESSTVDGGAPLSMRTV